MDYFIRNIPNEIHAEIKRVAKQREEPIAQAYRQALRDWYALRQKGVIR